MECRLCPVACGSDRNENKGYCGVRGVKIAKYYLHPYEEPCISFSKGSGCVFFCGCSLKCVFCQNYEVSRATRGKEISVKRLSEIFRELEEAGADNINLVNPTHFVKEIGEAFALYRPKIPVVYNTHGYEKLETVEEADKFTDIFLPDLKFIDNALSARYTSRPDYADYALPAIKRMAQKPLKFDDNGKLLSGTVIRHLILPLAVYDTVNIIKFVASLGDGVYFSLMRQYTPFGDIDKFPELKRKITEREYGRALAAVEEYGLEKVFLQDKESAAEEFIPDWDY